NQKGCFLVQRHRGMVSAVYAWICAATCIEMRPSRLQAKGTLFDTFPASSREAACTSDARDRSRIGHLDMLIGYARISTDEQNLDLQIDALEGAGCSRILSDTGYSGALKSRPALDEAIGYLKPGDTLVTWRLDRLGRSLSHLMQLIAKLES